MPAAFLLWIRVFSGLRSSTVLFLFSRPPPLLCLLRLSSVCCSLPRQDGRREAFLHTVSTRPDMQSSNFRLSWTPPRTVIHLIQRNKQTYYATSLSVSEETRESPADDEEYSSSMLTVSLIRTSFFQVRVCTYICAYTGVGVPRGEVF